MSTCPHRHKRWRHNGQRLPNGVRPGGERFAELKGITQPTLVVNGHNDIMVPIINSFTLSQKIPNSQLIVYPDSGHGSLFQFPELFVTHGRIFLDGPPAGTETERAP